MTNPPDSSASEPSLTPAMKRALAAWKRENGSRPVHMQPILEAANAMGKTAYKGWVETLAHVGMAIFFTGIAILQMQAASVPRLPIKPQ